MKSHKNEFSFSRSTLLFSILEHADSVEHTGQETGKMRHEYLIFFKFFFQRIRFLPFVKTSARPALSLSLLIIPLIMFIVSLNILFSAKGF
jgi:hypothetical protein